MRAMIALMLMMPMAANAAEPCRSYSIFLADEPGLTLTILSDGVLLEDEDFSEVAHCVGNVCTDTSGSFTINKEVVGEYIIVNGMRLDAACQ